MAALILFGAARLYYRLTDDFRLGNITHEFPPRSEWAVADPTKQQQTIIDSILKQKFYYIGKGAQSYAFGSEDGQYVLKFFKFKHLRPSPLLDWLPPLPAINAYREKQSARKERKFEGVFSGYHLAYERHKDESGLIFIHLNPSQNLFPTVTLVDKIGRKHHIDLDHVVFILQYKAETMRTVLHTLLEQGQLDLAKERISQIFALYLSEYQKGIYDHDHGIMHNAGFVGDRPIHLDVGKLKQDDNMRLKDHYAEDIQLVAARMSRWLQENEPKYYPELKQHIDAIIQEITQK